MSNLRSGSKVIHGTGEAEFTLHYQALVMKPIKGEVVDCSVEKVGKLGFFCLLGPMQIFVSTHVSSAVSFLGRSSSTTHTRTLVRTHPRRVRVVRGVRMMTRKHRDILPFGA